MHCTPTSMLGKTACCNGQVPDGRVRRPLVVTVDAVPPSWRHAVARAWWYRVSSFSYCVAGGLCALQPEPLVPFGRPCCPRFPFRAMGLLIALNGLVSYVSDVVMFGKTASAWKMIDVLLASSNTVVQILLVLLQVGGLMSFPSGPATLLGVSIAVALYCKRRGSRALRDGECIACLKWHAAWHYTLPLGALAAQLWIIDLHYYDHNRPQLQPMRE